MNTKFLEQLELDAGYSTSGSAITVGDSGTTIAGKAQGQINSINQTGTGILYSNGTSLSIATSPNFPTLNQDTTGTATYATNIAGGEANKIPYQTASGTTSFTGAVANGIFYNQGGNFGIYTTPQNMFCGAGIVIDPTTSGNNPFNTAVSHIYNAIGTITLAKGGTNKNNIASNGGIFYSDSSTITILSKTSTANQIILSGSSSAPSWSTTTYASSFNNGDLLYASSANAITGLAGVDGGIYITNSSGIPSCTTTTTGLYAGSACSDGYGTSATQLDTNLSTIYSTTGSLGATRAYYTANSGNVSLSSTSTSQQQVTGASITITTAGYYVISFNCYQTLTTQAGDIGYNLISQAFMWLSGGIEGENSIAFNNKVYNGNEIFSGNSTTTYIDGFDAGATIDTYVQLTNATAGSDTFTANATITAYQIG